MLEHYGEALGAGDLDAIAGSWDIPSLVLSDQGSIAVTERQQVKDFFAQAVQWYKTQGYASTHPQVEQVYNLSPRLAMCDVLWPMLDASGTEKGRERASYVLRLGEDGKLRIVVAFTSPSEVG
jgi:hypothetical protein